MKVMACSLVWMGLLPGGLCAGAQQDTQEGPLPVLNRAPDGAAAPRSGTLDGKREGAGTLNNEAVLRMTKAEVGDAIILQTVRTQPGVYRTGPDDVIALKQAGVSESVISAMLARTSGMTQRATANGSTATGAADGAESKPVEVTALSPEVDDPGVYWKNKQGQWEPVSPELVKYRDGGALKSLATNNIVKKDKNGLVSGPKSSLVMQPGAEMLILAPRQADAVEYIILRLREKSDRREFRVQTGNVFHSETGSDRDQLDIPIRKVSSRIFSFTVPTDLKKGEFGVLPPGSASTPGISYAGKIYTFAVRE